MNIVGTSMLVRTGVPVPTTCAGISFEEIQDGAVKETK